MGLIQKGMPGYIQPAPVLKRKKWRGTKEWAYSRTTGSYPYSDEDMKHVCWCHNNGIYVSPFPNWNSNGNEWFMELKIKGVVHKDPVIYTAEETHSKMYEYYKYYYDKYNR